MRSIVWRFLLVALVIAWALSEVYPWKQRNMVDVMREQAVDRMDDTLDEVLEQQNPVQLLIHLVELQD